MLSSPVKRSPTQITKNSDSSGRVYDIDEKLEKDPWNPNFEVTIDWEAPKDGSTTRKKV
jgi:hypothetical protein